MVKKYKRQKQETSTITIIKNLENLYPQIIDVQIKKIQYEGKYIIVTLDKKYNKLIEKYNKYQNFNNLHAEKINKIYINLEQKIPEEFIGWCMFNEYD